MPCTPPAEIPRRAAEDERFCTIWFAILSWSDTYWLWMTSHGVLSGLPRRRRASSRERVARGLPENLSTAPPTVRFARS